MNIFPFYRAGQVLLLGSNGLDHWWHNIYLKEMPQSMSSSWTATCRSHLDFHASLLVHLDKFNFSSSPTATIFMLLPHQAFQSHQVFKGRIKSQLPSPNTLFHIKNLTAAPTSKKEGDIISCLFHSESWAGQSATTPRPCKGTSARGTVSLTPAPPQKSLLVNVLWGGYFFPPFPPFVTDWSPNEQDEMARYLARCWHPHVYVWEGREAVSCTKGVLESSEMQLTAPQSMNLWRILTE